MRRSLLQALFAVAVFSFGTHLVLADDAGSDSPAKAAVPAADAADAEKEAEATKETSSPKLAETKESADSSGDEKAADDSPANPIPLKTEAAPENKPKDASSEDANSEDAKPTEPKPTEPKPTEPKPPLVPDSAKEASPGATETTATSEKLEPWQELHQQWLVIDKKLREEELKYDHTTDRTEQFKIRGQFENMIETEAVPLLAKLRTEVMKAYAAKPNENVEVVRLLIGFMVNHARMLEVAEAKEIVELLIDNKCDEKYVMVASKMPGLRPASLDILEQMEKRYKDALSAKDSNTDSDATPDSGNNSSPANENSGVSTGTPTEEKNENPSPSKTDPE